MFDINLVLFAVCFFLAVGMVVHFLARYYAEKILDTDDGKLIVDEHDPTDVKISLEFTKELDQLASQDDVVLKVEHRS